MSFSLRQCSPMIPSENLDLSMAFFTDLLGFEVRMDGEYGIVEKDGFAVHLSPAEDEPPQMSCYLEVDDLDTVWAKLEPQSDLLEMRPPFNRPYGMREVHVIVPATAALLFIGQPTG